MTKKTRGWLFLKLVSYDCCDILWQIFHLQVSIRSRSFILNFSEIDSVEDDDKDSGIFVLEPRII
jgi:hypothetical protein